MDKKTGYGAFALLAVLIVLMGWATWKEYLYGGEYAATFFYGSLWFTLLWLLLATLACYYMIVVELHRRWAVFALHAAFLLMLSGALLTRLTGTTGQLHLRLRHVPAHHYMNAAGAMTALPFAASLKSFVIEYYPGTRSPADYVSVVEIRDARGVAEKTVSMNRILKYKGYRFYQSSFDADEQGAVLSVNHDPWGTGVSYAGYLLMFFAMIGILFGKRERFVFLLKKMRNKAGAVIVLLAMPALASAAPPYHPDSLTVSAEQAERWGKIYVEYNGRICPLQTLAGDFTVKLTGKARYQSFSGEQVLLGWLFFPEKWRQLPLLEIKSKELQRIAGRTGVACFADFFDAEGRNKLAPLLHRMRHAGKQDGWLKEAVKTDEKMHLVEMLLEGELLKIFPMHTVSGALQWFSPNMPLPMQRDTMENFFARHFLPLYGEEQIRNRGASSGWYVDKLLSFQQKKAGSVLPATFRVQAERFYNKIRLFPLLFKACLSIGLLSLAFFIVAVVRHRQVGRWETFFYLLLVVAFLANTLGIGLRTCISGRIPLSNSYETMLALSWLSLLTGILARRYSFLTVVFGFLLSGFSLLVAHIGSMNPQMTPLMPVLQSPLLNIHVLTIMVSYGLCGFMALNSLTAWMSWIFGKKGAKRQAYVLRMKELSELFMYPAAFLMGTGIFIGAVWANLSWGRYWGWDPKEVWALITFLLMSFTFHGRTLKWIQRPMVYHTFVVLIFLSVLMTYFGVNYLLGGRHSYAG
jgi:ABC-type transport system involved in cytochrome c biogenesis permease subunit